MVLWSNDKNGLRTMLSAVDSFSQEILKLELKPPCCDERAEDCLFLSS